MASVGGVWQAGQSFEYFWNTSRNIFLNLICTYLRAYKSGQVSYLYLFMFCDTSMIKHSYFCDITEM
jgi:hypothetical protein